MAPLAESRISEIFVIGRRGPAQAKFTSAELKELGRISNCAALVDAKDLELNAASMSEIADPRGDEAKKNLEILAPSPRPRRPAPPANRFSVPWRRR